MAVLSASLFGLQPAKADWTGPFYTVSQSNVQGSSTDMPTNIATSVVNDGQGNVLQSTPTSINGTWTGYFAYTAPYGTPYPGKETGDMQGLYKWSGTVYYKWVGTGNPTANTWTIHCTPGAYKTNDENAAYDEVIVVDGSTVSSTAGNAAPYGQGVYAKETASYNSVDNCYEISTSIRLTVNAYTTQFENDYNAFTFKTTVQFVLSGSPSPAIL